MSKRRDPDAPIDPNAAVDYIIANAPAFAAAKAKRRYLEEFRKTKKALLMAASGGKSVGAREEYAYGHPEYLTLLEGLEAAVEQEETLLWRLKAAELRTEVWRSQEASNRNQDRSAR